MLERHVYKSDQNSDLLFQNHSDNWKNVTRHERTKYFTIRKTQTWGDRTQQTIKNKKNHFKREDETKRSTRVNKPNTYSLKETEGEKRKIKKSRK